MPGKDNSNPFEGWVTVQQAAQAIGRKPSTLKRWVDQGYITSHQIGYRTKVVNLEEVKAYAEAHPPRDDENSNQNGG